MAQECAPFVDSEYLEQCPEPIANNAVCAGYDQGKRYVYSFGGIDSSKSHEGIHLRSWRYDIQENLWEDIPSIPDTSGKIAAAATYLDGIIYIIGGYHVLADGSEKSSRKIHRFDCGTNSFLSDGADLPVAIDDHVQVLWKDSLIVVLTGWSNSGNVAWLQLYDPSIDQWTASLQLWNFSVFNSFGASGSIAGDTLYYLGGASSSGSFPIQPYLRKGVIDSQDPTQIEWSYNQITSDQALYRAASVSMDGSVLWLGGSKNTYNYDGIAYDGSGGVPPSDLILQVRAGAPVSASCPLLNMDYRGVGWFPEHGELYLVGGMAMNQKVSSDLVRLTTGPLQIEETKTPQIQVYPVPSAGELHLKSNEPIDFYVYNNLGAVVDGGSLSSELKLNLSPGLYFLKWRSDSHAGQNRILIK